MKVYKTLVVLFFCAVLFGCNCYGSQTTDESYPYLSGNSDSLYSAAIKGLRKAEKEGRTKDKVYFLLNLSKADIIQSNLNLGYSRQLKAVDLAVETGDSMFLAKVYLELGILFAELEIHYKALEYLTEAIDIGSDINDSNLISVAIFNYALVLSEEGDYSAAAFNAERSLEYAGDSVSYFDLMLIYTELAFYHYQIGNKSHGEKFITKGQELLQRLDSTEYNPYFFYYKALYDTLKNDYRGAAAHAQEAYEVALSLDNHRAAAAAKLLLADIFISLDNLNRAFESLNDIDVLLQDNQINSHFRFKLLKKSAYVHHLKGEVQKADNLMDKALEALETLKFEERASAALVTDLFEAQKENELLYTKNKRQLEAEQRKNTQVLVLAALLFFAFLILGILFYLYGRNKRLLNLRRNIISTAVHDIKGPVAQLEATLEILANDSNTNVLKSLLPDLRNNLKNTRITIDEILNWAKDSMLKEQPKSEAVNVEKVVNDVISFVVFEAKEKEIMIKTEVDTEHTVLGDRDYLLIILRNFLSNAVKYSPKKSDVVISSQRSGNKICLSVADKGRGIPEDLKGTLFEMPLNSSKTVSPAVVSGLGLYLSNKFAKKSGGKITFQSSAETGTTFTVCFPSATKN